MAGDWIKMRANLRRHPKVVRIASALNADRLRVVGGLHAVWCLFDEHSIDGQLSGYTPSAVDDEIGWPGFTRALIAIGWLESDGNDGLALPEFDTHNGASAKRRAQETDRKRAERAAPKDGPQGVLSASASGADKLRSREEKRREDKETPHSPQGGEAARFDRFWTAYPRKVGKDAARKAFTKRKPDDALLATMLRAIAWQCNSDQWKREAGQFIPHPSTWLHQGRWQDEQPGESTPWQETRTGVELRGIELGVGPWTETEQFGAYRSRVLKAHEQRAH